MAEKKTFNPSIISFSSIKKHNEDIKETEDVSTKDLKAKLINAKAIAKTELKDINNAFEEYINNLENNSTAECSDYISSIRSYHEALCTTIEYIIDNNDELKEYLGPDYNKIRKEFYSSLVKSIENKENGDI